MRFADLATRAALGTTNRPVSTTDLPAQLPAAGDDPATVLLDAAASFALARRADVAAGPDTPVVLPEPSKPAAPAAFVAMFHRIRADLWARGPIQVEALRLLAERGLALPPGLVLELIADPPGAGVPMRLLGGAIDERTWALLRLNPEWAGRLDRSGAADATDPRLWDEGTLPQRAAHLAAVRRTDPAAGLALVEQLTWRKETAEARERFLGELRPGLSGIDEPLLERCLDDRARNVRLMAASLLASLPGSALLARAESLARTQLSHRRRLLRTSVTEASGVPRTDATTRDGYPAAEPDTPTAARARLRHVVSLVPPDRWPALLGASAIELATGPLTCDGQPFDLSTSWAAAAVRWRDAALARALLAAAPALLPTLGPLLAPDERATQVGRRLRTAPAAYANLGTLLPARFDAPMTAALAEVAELWATAPAPPGWQLADLLKRLASGADPAAAAGLAVRLRTLGDQLPPGARSLRHAAVEASSVLQLRGALVDTLADHPPRKVDS